MRCARIAFGSSFNILAYLEQVLEEDCSGYSVIDSSHLGRAPVKKDLCTLRGCLNSSHHQFV